MYLVYPVSDNLRLSPEACLISIGKTDSSPVPRNVSIPGVFLCVLIIVICRTFVARACSFYRTQYVTSFSGSFSRLSGTIKTGFKRSIVYSNYKCPVVPFYHLKWTVVRRL
jgi:hypothetical protein